MVEHQVSIHHWFEVPGGPGVLVDVDATNNTIDFTLSYGKTMGVVRLTRSELDKVAEMLEGLVSEGHKELVQLAELCRHVSKAFPQDQ